MEELISTTEVDAFIAESSHKMPVERVPFEQSMGRVLRETVLAERDFPPFDRVMMDGVALSSQAFSNEVAPSLAIQEFAGAGQPATTLSALGLCVETATGAILPMGCDAVVPYEHLDIANGRASLKPGFEVKAGQYIHKQGSDYPQQAALLQPGVTIGARELAIIASCGLTEIAVSKAPEVHIVSIGDELRDINETVEPHHVRRSNVYAVQAILGSCYHIQPQLHHFPDDEAQLEQGIAQILKTADIVALSGAVSKGKRDHLRDILPRLGVEKVFHGVQQRPGKPFWYGTMGSAQVFALPGNPVSTLVGAIRYVLPSITRRVGRPNDQPIWAVLCDAYTFPPPVTCFLPVKLTSRRDGSVTARPMPVNNSGDFASLVHSDGFIELPADLTEFEPGYAARFYPWGCGICCH